MNPVTLLLRRFMAKLGKVDLQEEFALFWNLIRRESHIVLNLPEKTPAFHSAEHAVFLMILGDVAVDPLPVGYVKQFTDKMMSPVVAGKDTISQKEMRMLDREKAG